VHFTDTPEKVQAGAERLFDALRCGILRPTFGGRFPLAEAAEAHRRLEARETIGSLILVP
jgi:NADPH2:quinone reductase